MEDDCLRAMFLTTLSCHTCNLVTLLKTMQKKILLIIVATCSLANSIYVSIQSNEMLVHGAVYSLKVMQYFLDDSGFVKIRSSEQRHRSHVHSVTFCIVLRVRDEFL